MTAAMYEQVARDNGGTLAAAGPQVDGAGPADPGVPAPAGDTGRQSAASTRLAAPARRKETPEYMAMVRRCIRAAGRRVGAEANVEALADMAALSAELDLAMGDAVATLRQRWGMSYTDIARGLGITRQTAQERFAGPAWDGDQ